jgi:cytochrome d ubiquinol oxidase subunit II
LWTDFAPGANAGILDWYTVLIDVAALLALAMHGALWLVLRAEGEVKTRSLALARRLWWPVAACVALITAASFSVQPHLHENFDAYPAIYAVPLLTVAALAGAGWLRRGLPRFLASCAFLVGMLVSAAIGLYPDVLPANSDPALSLTVYNSAAAPYGLRIGLFWFIPGMVLAVAYFVYTYRSFAGPLRAEDEGY